MTAPRCSNMNLKRLLIFLVIIFLWSHSSNLLALAQQDSARDKALLDAVEKGDQQKVLELLKQGANVNAKGINDTALETAIFQQDVAMVRLLLDHDAKIKAGDLGDAARGSQGDNAKAARIVSQLLEKGANLSACTERVVDANDSDAAEPST